MSTQKAIIRVLCKSETAEETASLLAWAVGHHVEIPEPVPNAGMASLLILTDLAYYDDDDTILERFGLDIVGKIRGVISWEVLPSQTNRAPVGKQQDLEYDMTAILRSLPVPISIMKRASGKYVWKWQEATGQADSFVSAVRSSLTHVMKSYVAIRDETIGA